MTVHNIIESLSHGQHLQEYAFMFCFQKTVKDYMSQKFRNLRRKSEPVLTDGQVKSKFITAKHATPVVPFFQSPSLEEGDDIAYERNTQLLKEELSKSAPTTKGYTNY